MKKIYNYDLHIHSNASAPKENKTIVKNSKIENIDVLFNALVSNRIDIFSITDHNVIDLDLYLKIHDIFNQNKYNITNFFVGIELDVDFSKDNNSKTHILVYLDLDKNTERNKFENNIKNINEILDKYLIKKIDNNQIKESNWKMNFDNYVSFLTQVQFLEIKTITVATQKQDPENFSEGNNSFSANTKDDKEFKYFYNWGYLNGFEVTSSKVKKMVEIFMENNSLIESAIISGSDCHDWSVYPKHDFLEPDLKIKKSFLANTKPDFNGLKLIFSFPKTRINNINFSSSNFLESFEIEFNQQVQKLNLKRGLNVIFGENGVGKTTILQKLNKKIELERNNPTNKNKSTPGRNIEVKNYQKKNVDNQITTYFMEQDKQKAKTDLFIPIFKEICELEEDVFVFDFSKKLLSLILNIIREKINIKNEKNKISNLNLNLSIDENWLSNTYLPNVKPITKPKKDSELKKHKDLKKIKSTVMNKLKIEDIESSEFVINGYDQTINEQVEKVKYEIDLLKKLIEDSFYEENIKSNIINEVGVISDSYSLALSSRLDEKDFKIKEFKENAVTLLESVYGLFKMENNLKKLLKDYEEIYLDYKVPSKNDAVKIDKNIIVRREFKYKNFDFKTFFKKFKEFIFSNGIQLIWENVDTLEDFALVCRNMGNNNSSIQEIEAQFENNRDSFQKSLLKEVIEVSLKGDKNNMVDIEKLSPGESSLLSFSLVFKSEENKNKNLYMFDQPEDEISGKNITDYLIPIIINQSKNNQIIAITHNPNIIVNSDPENIIYLFEEKGVIKSIEGTIDDKKMTTIIEEKVEGGREALEGRLNIYYEKN